MRISDWSSDVCSSDLQNRRDFGLGEIHAREYPALHIVGKGNLKPETVPEQPGRLIVDAHVRNAAVIDRRIIKQLAGGAGFVRLLRPCRHDNRNVAARSVPADAQSDLVPHPPLSGPTL